MKIDLLEYREQLVKKLQTVDIILSDMGAQTPPKLATRPTGQTLTMSAKKKISEAKKKWWAARKAGGHGK